MKRVLFLGNSITKHGPKPEIGWFDDWGMAASAVDKDYAHLVLRHITEKFGAEPDARIVNIADFEREFKIYDIAVNYRTHVEFDADIIILAIGENVPCLLTDEDKTAFHDSFTALLALLSRDNKPSIYVRGSFWVDAVKDAIMKKVCLDFGGTFIDISNLSQDEGNYARSERNFSHDGVAAHPGDAGMAAIANAIIIELGITN